MVPQYLIWECGNFVTVNGLWSPHTLSGCANLMTGSPHMYNMICMWEPCNCQWHLWSLHTWWHVGTLLLSMPYGPPYLIWNAGALQWGPPTCIMCKHCNCQWLFWSLHTLYGMWEPCNCQWLMVPIPYMKCGECCNRSHHMYNMNWMQEPCYCQWLMVPHTLYGMQEPC